MYPNFIAIKYIRRNMQNHVYKLVNIKNYYYRIKLIEIHVQPVYKTYFSAYTNENKHTHTYLHATAMQCETFSITLFNLSKLQFFRLIYEETFHTQYAAKCGKQQNKWAVQLWCSSNAAVMIFVVATHRCMHIYLCMYLIIYMYIKVFEVSYKESHY